MPYTASLALSLFGALLASAPQDVPQDAPPSSAAPAVKTSGDEVAIADLDLEAYRRRLLDVAFESVSAMPTVPHAKNRARAQEKVVSAALELGQARLAIDYTTRMSGWRRGLCFADCADYCASHGAKDEAHRYLVLAAAVAADPQDAAEQEWRVDRIRARIAKAFWTLGEGRRALEFEQDLDDSALPELAEVRAQNMAAADAESWLVDLENATRVLGLEQARSAFEVLGKLYGRFYQDADVRDRIEAKLTSLGTHLPAQTQIDLLATLAETAIDAGDPANALRLVESALDLMESYKWRLEDRIATQARLAGLRFRAGDVDGARAELDACLALFDAEPNPIPNVYRADALRPVAEARFAMGDREGARAIYAGALEQGIDNPNGWPRSEDLAETCCSMAKVGFEPDEALWKRIGEIQALLGEPW